MPLKRIKYLQNGVTVLEFTEKFQMSRQVNVKALVSHVVRGDGINKCRICMGDTSEGQVFLGDTVLLDGEQPVTLSELLETITGVEVPINEELPVSLCSICSVSALRAADFRTVCRQAARNWESMLELLSNLTDNENKTKTLFAVMETNKMVLITDCDHMVGTKSAARRLAQRLKEMEITETVKTLINHPLQCPECGRKCPNAYLLYQHLKESTDFKRACYICAKIMTRDELVVHLSEEHSRKPFDCKKCPALLPSYKQYVHHLRQAHSHGSCTCGDCGRTFKTSNAYRAHVSIHSVRTCPSCDKIFRNQACFRHHVKKCCNLDNRQGVRKGMTIEVKNKKTDKKIMVGLRGRTDRECICDYCGKRFSGKKYISAHIQIVHTKSTHRPCGHCGKLLAAAHMTEHVKYHTERSYKCGHCNSVLKSKLGYIQHLRLHSGEKPYSCSYCGESFSASSRRSEHVRRAHRSLDAVLKHACSQCPAVFRAPYLLRKHVTTVHNRDEGDPLFECFTCHEKFSSCRGLLHHSKLHQHK